MTDTDENPMGLTWIFSVLEFLFNLIAVEVPIPTERFGFTLSVTRSPSDNPCAEEIETTELILLNTPPTLSYRFKKE